jgi:hypothetical protein
MRRRIDRTGTVCLAAAILYGQMLGCMNGYEAFEIDSDAGGDTDTDADSDAEEDTETGSDADTDTESSTGGECAEPCVRFVDVDAVGPGDGCSWATAFTSVQDGIDSAAACAPGQVWIAEGTYFSYVADPSDSIALAPDVEVLGGFDGGETSVDARDWVDHETILDGRNGFDGAATSYHVVVGANDAILDGFTIANGVATEDTEWSLELRSFGGGMLNDDASPTVRNCKFTENYAVNWGGAVMNTNGSSAVFIDCVFVNNTAGSDGGGLANWYADVPVIERCTFFDNYSGRNGGGVYSGLSDAVFTNIYVSGNTAAQAGGGIGVFNCAPRIENSVFSGNHSDQLGGGFGGSLASAEFVNCTFYDNTADEPGGAAGTCDDDAAVFINCIMWGDSPDEFDSAAPAGIVSYSVVQGGFFGDGNIDSDPLFLDALGYNLHLSSGSPCIDAADGLSAPTLDLDGDIRVDDPETGNTGIGPPWADMGAFEYQP